jgi:hypothetical protein
MVCIGEMYAVTNDRRLAVGRHRKRDAVVQNPKALEFRSTEDVIGNEDIRDPGIGHHLGLADLLASDADRTEFDLPVGKERQLVGLYMRAQWQVMFVGIGLRAGEVRFRDASIDQNAWCIEIFDFHRPDIPLYGTAFALLKARSRRKDG